MKTTPLFTIFLFIGISLSAKNAEKKTYSDSVFTFGMEQRMPNFFKNYYLHNSTAHYLDNYSDNVVYQTETTGDFQTPDINLFSINGNSFKWNKYYWNGFRTDNRYFSGTNPYNFDLYSHELKIDFYNTSLYFETDTSAANSVSFSYNVGGLGGISPFTEELVNLFHLTASQRLFQPDDYRNKILNNRRKIKGAGTLLIDQNIEVKGKHYLQQISANFGARMLVGHNENGIDSYYPEDFFKAEIKGEMPIKVGDIFDRTYYMAGISMRENLFTELNYSQNESAKNRNINFSLFGKKGTNIYDYTSGFSFFSNSVVHQQPNFSRNLFDQDGEAFEPWYPDTRISEFSHSLNYTKQLTKHLYLSVDCYNTAIVFDPYTNNYTNPVFALNNNFNFQALYIYEWSSKKFTAGLLENTIKVSRKQSIGKKIFYEAAIDATFDGMLISGKSLESFNWQGELNIRYKPSEWFSFETNFNRKRVAYNFGHIGFFSDNYLIGDIYFWNDENADSRYQENERADFFTSTGGKVHKASDKLKQPTYFTFDMPITFNFGKHKISLLNTYKKYNNSWTTRFEGNAEDHGSYADINGQKIFFLNQGTINYVVDHYPQGLMHSGSVFDFLTNSPFYLSSTMKYEYLTEKWFFSFAWSSFLHCGISALGNGPLHNNIDVLSESSANPNSLYKIIGRLDQDRAYTARILLSYNVNKHLSMALSGKFKDGQPFTNFNTALYTNENGYKKLAIWNNRTKGINPFNGNFGSRDDAFFNTELRASYRGKIAQTNFELNMMLYNIYDFGTELVEFSFQPDASLSRYAMEMNIPRGIMITGKFYF